MAMAMKKFKVLLEWDEETQLWVTFIHAEAIFSCSRTRS